MRISGLSLKNIGPFEEAELTLAEEGETAPSVVLITGENGTGKSIILDALRGILSGNTLHLERDIRRKSSPNEAEILLKGGLSGRNPDTRITSVKFGRQNIFTSRSGPPDTKDYIYDYWPSTINQAGDGYRVNSIKPLSAQSHLSLSGTRPGVQITELILYVDYMRTSNDAEEKRLGEALYGVLERIFELSLLKDGKLSHVSRKDLQPKIIQNGELVDLENLSSGNLYLVRNMVLLLRKMLAVNTEYHHPLDRLCKTSGLLLIDEAENQLHPKWQKRLLGSIQELFPNLQIIAATHSPFIIASAPDAKLFLCKSAVDHSEVEDVTDAYANKPVDEILMSPLFEETLPYNQQITDLLAKRDLAIDRGNQAEQENVEAQLKALNPTAFAYFDVERLLAQDQV